MCNTELAGALLAAVPPQYFTGGRVFIAAESNRVEARQHMCVEKPHTCTDT